MRKFEKPMISVSFFEAENVVTTSSAEVYGTYATNELNKSMFDKQINTTTTVLEFK